VHPNDGDVGVFVVVLVVELVVDELVDVVLQAAAAIPVLKKNINDTRARAIPRFLFINMPFNLTFDITLIITLGV
jgi:hypothetical protein